MAEVAKIQFDVEDADVRLNRLDLTFDPADGNDEDEPWEAFDTVRLLVDGRQIAKADVSDEDDWLNDDQPYVFRFANLDYIVREGRTVNITVEIEAQRGVVNSGGNDEWTIYVGSNGIRAIDAAGIQQYIGTSSESTRFDLVEEGAGEQLNVRSSSRDPQSSTLEVDDNGRSDWHPVFGFTLEARDNDIELDQLPIEFTAGTADVRNVIDDVRLVIGRETFDDFTWQGSGRTASTTFDIDGDYKIDEDERVEVRVDVRFKAANGVNYNPSDTIQASIQGADIEAEGADDLNGDGNASGEIHVLEISGLSSASTPKVSAATTVVDGGDNDYGTFTIQADITAFDQDVFIPRTAVEAFTYQIENASTGAVVSTSSATTSSISSNASSSGDYYRIGSGQTKTFIFTVTYDPLPADEASFYRLQLLSVEFADSSTAPDRTWMALPQNVYETSPTYIND